MDVSAEGSEPLEDPACEDPQLPEEQVQAQISDLENSLFILQYLLQLLDSEYSRAERREAEMLTYHRQGPHPLSQPTLEAGPEGHSDVDKRASLSAGPVGISPESPSESKEEPAGASSEANGPCPGLSPLTGQSPSPATAEGGIVETKREDVVEVVWEGLRPTEDCAMASTGPKLEAKVEQVVLEALGARQRAGSIMLPARVKKGRIQRAQGEVSSEEHRALGEEGEPQAKAVNKAATPQDVKPEDQGRGGSEKQEGLEVAGKPQPLAESQGPHVYTAPLLAEASGPKQKTCQCCVVM